MLRKLFIHPTQHIIIQLIRYGFVAIAAQVVDFGLLYVFTHHLHIPSLLSAAMSFTISLVANYFLSSLWVFSQSAYKRSIEIMIFFIVAAGGLGLTLLIMWALTASGMFYLHAKLVAIFIVFFWSFLGRRYLVFSKFKALRPSSDTDSSI